MVCCSFVNDVIFVEGVMMVNVLVIGDCFLCLFVLFFVVLLVLIVFCVLVMV